MLKEFNNNCPKEYLYTAKELYEYYKLQKLPDCEIIDYRLIKKDVERTKRKEQIYN